MRFLDARRMLASPPTRLPPTPRELIPVVVANPGGAPGGVPSFPDSAGRPAAVLILIYPAADGHARLVLTERSAGGHRHAGQISLPGGAIEAGETAADAALREAGEEVGLDPAAAGLEIAGVLPAVDVRVSGFVVQPVIAFAAREPELRPDMYEVAAVLSAPLAAFLPGAPIEITTAERDGYTLRYGAYPIGSYRVWGATAGILGRLGAYLGSAASG